jgi:hypothetical protein
MEMKRLSIAEVHEQKIAELGLDSSSLDLTSIEAIAGALRRVASFLCPCATPTLIRGVVQPLRGLVDDLEKVKAIVEDTLEAMIAHGDILEHRDLEENLGHKNSVMLYAAPAAFVTRRSGTVILLGIASDQLSALTDDLEARIEYVNHLRRLSPTPGENLRSDLVQLGLIELSYADWLRMPPIETAEQHLLRLDHILDAMQPSRDVPGLLLLDSERPVRYYRGRWVEPRSHSGRFVARRSQAYGAQLWSYVQVLNGNPESLIDFPIAGSRWRGCDEAWRLQIAIDAKRGDPQRFRIRPGPENTSVMEFFSPVPMWARRRWDAVGEPVLSSGCLFAYRLAKTELAEELRFASEVLWLDELTGK